MEQQATVLTVLLSFLRENQRYYQIMGLAANKYGLKRYNLPEINPQTIMLHI